MKINRPFRPGKTNPIKPNLHGGLNERELLCRKRVMKSILKTAKFTIIMMLALRGVAFIYDFDQDGKQLASFRHTKNYKG